MFKISKKKKNKYAEYPCECYLHNALWFLEEGKTEHAYSEICHAIVKSGDSLKPDEDEKFKEICRRIYK